MLLPLFPAELPTVIMLLENCEVCSEGICWFPRLTHCTTLFSLELGDCMRVLFRDFRYRSVSTSGIRPLYNSSDAIEMTEGRTEDACDGCVAEDEFISSILNVLGTCCKFSRRLNLIFG